MSEAAIQQRYLKDLLDAIKLAEQAEKGTQDDQELVAVLKKNYKLDKSEVNAVLELVQGKAKQTTNESGDNSAALAKVKAFCEICGVRSTNRAGENLSLKSIRQRVYNMRSKINKEETSD